MIEDTVSNIEAKIQASDSIKDDRKRELLQLLGTLKAEIATLSKTNEEGARSIAGFTEISTHEATRTQGSARTLRRETRIPEWSDPARGPSDVR